MLDIWSTEMEAAEQAKKEREAAAAAEQVTTNAVSYTPDYAAGLVSPAPSVSIYTFMLYTGADTLHNIF